MLLSKVVAQFCRPSVSVCCSFSASSSTFSIVNLFTFTSSSECIVVSHCELIMILGSLSANAWGCVPVLLVAWHGVSSTVACWSLSGSGS